MHFGVSQIQFIFQKCFSFTFYEWITKTHLIKCIRKHSTSEKCNSEVQFKFISVMHFEDISAKHFKYISEMHFKYISEMHFKNISVMLFKYISEMNVKNILEMNFLKNTSNTFPYYISGIHSNGLKNIL